MNEVQKQKLINAMESLLEKAKYQNSWLYHKSSVWGRFCLSPQQLQTFLTQGVTKYAVMSWELKNPERLSV